MNSFSAHMVLVCCTLLHQNQSDKINNIRRGPRPASSREYGLFIYNPKKRNPQWDRSDVATSQKATYMLIAIAVSSTLVVLDTAVPHCDVSPCSAVPFSLPPEPRDCSRTAPFFSAGRPSDSRSILCKEYRSNKTRIDH